MWTIFFLQEMVYIFCDTILPYLILSENRYLQDITKNNWREKASN